MLNSRTLLLTIALIFHSSLKAEIQFPKVGGWKMSETAKIFDSETLWEYINGAAEAYLSYHFMQVEVMEYARSEDNYIKVEVYQQGSAIDAFGIYAMERPQEAEFLELGVEGYLVHSSLNFYAEDYYVKIQSHQSDEKTLAAIRKIAEKVAVVIAENPEKPVLLDLMPDYDKVHRSEKYFSSNFLGYSFLSNTIVADYLSNGTAYKMFVLISDDQEASLSVMQRYFEQTKTEATPVEQKVFSINDFFNGPVSLMVIDRFLLGIVDLSDKELATEYIEQFSNYVDLSQ